MSKFLIATKAEAKALRRALRKQDDLPARGVTVGPVAWEPPELQVDEDGDPVPTPGYTTDNLPEADEDGDTVAIEVPKRLEKHAGRRVKGVDVPALVDEADLPEGVKQKRAKKRDEATAAAERVRDDDASDRDASRTRNRVRTPD